MATFSSLAFSSADYAAYRPTYPLSLYERILAYHNNDRREMLLDLGSGPGPVSRALAPYFGSVTALDPSPVMISQAQQLISSLANINFHQGPAEDLSFLPANSVDVVVSGQAAHWFDYPRLWPELARVVKPRGTLAFWGYKDFIIVDHPAVTDVFDKFTYAEGEVVPGVEGMARFWELKGRAVLRDSFRSVKLPEGDWAEEKRVIWDPDRETARVDGVSEEDGAWLRKTWTLGVLEGYMRTFSAFSKWKEGYPDRQSRLQGGEGDLIDLLFDEVVGAVEDWKAVGENWREIQVDVIWGTVFLMAKRKDIKL